MRARQRLQEKGVATVRTFLVSALTAAAAAGGFAAAAKPAPVGGGAPLVLAVMYFDDRGSGAEWTWLRKGLADLLITDLAASDRLVLIERERIEEMLAERQLAARGAVDSDGAKEIGRLLDADAALVGGYLVTDGRIEAEARIVDMKTGALRRAESVEGPVSDLPAVEKRLAERILANLDVPLTEDELSRLRRVQTGSVDALASHYRGVDFYDRGDYARALGQFLLASRADPTYASAALRIARAYADMGEAGHAMLAFREAAASFETDPLIPRIRFEFGRFLQSAVKDPEGAVSEYTRVIDAVPDAARSPEELIDEYFAFMAGLDEIARRRHTGELTLSEGAKAQGDAVRGRVRAGRDRAPARKSLYRRAQAHRELGDPVRAFRDIYLATALYPDFEMTADEELRAIRSALPIYYYDAAAAGDPGFEAPSWIRRFEASGDPVEFGADEQGEIVDSLARLLWGRMPLEAPPGKVFDRIALEVELTPERDGDFPVLMVADYFGGHGTRRMVMVREFDPDMLQFERDVEFRPCAKMIGISATNPARYRRVVVRPLFREQAEIDLEEAATTRSKLAVHYRPDWAQVHVGRGRADHGMLEVRPGLHEVRVSAPGYPEKAATVEVGRRGRTVLMSLEHDWELPRRIAEGLRHPTMVWDWERDLFHLVAEGREDTVRVLCSLHSPDGENWGEMRRLAVNSMKNDGAPSLIQAEDGSLVLAWISGRDEEFDNVVCVSVSEDGLAWRDPVLVRPLKRRTREPAVVSLLQRSDGAFWLITDDAFYESADAVTWTLRSAPPREGEDFEAPIPAVMLGDDGRPEIIVGSREWPYLQGSEVFQVWPAAPGAALRVRSAEAHAREYPHLTLLGLPGNRVLAAGGFSMGRKASTGSLVSVRAADGVWSPAYAVGVTEAVAAFAWDRRDRIVCVIEERGFAPGSSGAADALAATVCGLDRLEGRPETRETPWEEFNFLDMKMDAATRAFLQRNRVETVYPVGRKLFAVAGDFGAKDGGLIVARLDDGTAGLIADAGFGSRHEPGPARCDFDGTDLWFSTYVKGLYRLDPESETGHWITEADGLPSDRVTAVCCHEGEVFFGMETGLGILDARTERVIEIHSRETTGMPFNPVASVAVQGARVWIGGIDSGAAVLDRSTGEWTHFEYDWHKIGKGGPDIMSTYLPCIFVRENSVFFPMNGIPEYNTVTRHWTHYLRGPFCNYAVRDGDTLWYCSQRDGIFSFDMKTRELRRHFARTPSWYGWNSGPNYPVRMALVGDDVLIGASDRTQYWIAKRELEENSHVLNR